MYLSKTVMSILLDSISLSGFKDTATTVYKLAQGEHRKQEREGGLCMRPLVQQTQMN
jgi:nickel-dependent lactate racemase